MLILYSILDIKIHDEYPYTIYKIILRNDELYTVYKYIYRCLLYIINYIQYLAV